MNTLKRALAPALLVLPAACAAAGGFAGIDGAAFVGSELIAPLKARGDAPVRMVACVGARGTGKSTMLRSMFGADVLVEDQGVALLEAESGFDYDRETGGFRVGARDASVALALSDVFIFNVLAQDLARDGMACLDTLQPALEDLLSRYADGALEDSGKKKTLVIAVRDFDGGDEDRKRVKETVDTALEAVWTRTLKPRSYRGAELRNVLDVSVSFLPHFSFASESYKDSVGQLRQCVLSAPDGETPAAEMARRLRSFAAGASSVNEAPAERELRGAHAAEAAATKAIAELRSTYARSLEAGAAAASGFGAACDVALEACLKAFDDAAGVAAGTTAGAKKRAEVRAAALRDLEARYRLRLEALRENALKSFATKVNGLRGSSALAKELAEAVAESDKNFVTAAKLLKPKNAAWPYEAARKALRDEVREMASERLQLTKLQGGSGAAGRTRRPIGVAFHWLLPKPFGTDARQSPLTTDDVLRYSGVEPTADPMFFEFAPLDKVPAPGSKAELEPAGWASVRQRAEKMIYKANKRR